MNRTHRIEAVLRELDAAPGHRSPQDVRARALLDRVVAAGTAEDRALSPATTAAAAGARPSPGPRPRRRRGRTVLVTGGLVAATSAALLVLPPLLGGGDTAYASWTAVPEDLSAQERPEAAEACRDEQRSSSIDDSYPQLDDAAVAIAERRGAWITVVLTGPGGFSATCTTDASDPFGEGWVGSAGVRSGWKPLGPRDLVAGGLGVAYVDGPLSMVVGEAGADVVGVSYDSVVHGTVVATVSGGRFALWMPGDEISDEMVSAGVPVHVTYTDGSTATVTLRL